MKFRSLFQILLELLFIFGAFPYAAVRLNNFYSLPVYDYIGLQITGLIFASVGLAIIIHCTYVLFFKPGQEIPPPSRAPEKFIVEGLYKSVRNPMYLGDFFIILAEFLLFGHVLIFIYLLILIPIVNIIVIFKEERDLEKKFGREYVRYKKRVPRWIPRYRAEN